MERKKNKKTKKLEIKKTKKIWRSR